MTTTKTRCGVIGLMVTLAVAASGCAGTVDDGAALPAADGPIAMTQQALPGYTVYSWGCSDPNGCNLNLGVALDQWTCFLGGVTGDLAGYQEVDGPAVLSEVDVQPVQGLFGSPGTWRLRVKSPLGHAIGGYAACVPTTANRAYATWTSGSSTTVIGTTPTRKCFLRGIKNLHGFETSNESVRTSRNLLTGTWQLGGSNLNGIHNTTAYAVCVDVPDEIIVDSRTVGAGVTQTYPLALNSPPNNTVCGLSKVGGIYRTNSYDDGVWTTLDAGTNIWTWTLVNSKTAEARCVR